MIRLTNQLLQATPAARIATPDGAGTVAPVTATGAVIQAVSTNGTQEVTVTRLQSQPLSSARLSSATAGTEGLMSPLDFSGGCVRPGSGLLSWWQGEWNVWDSLWNNPGEPGAGFDEGMVGTAFSFDGSSQSVQVPYLTSPACLATPSFTIECWVCPLAQSAGQAFIFGQAYGRQLVVTPGGEAGMWVSLYVADLNGYFDGTGGPERIPMGEWTHLAGTYDGTDLKLYINGALVAQIAPELQAILDSACPFSIGGINDACGYSGQYFCGLIDEVSVYDRALFHGEIKAIYDAGSEGKCKTQASCAAPPAGVVSWWPGENDASDALRINHGTVQNNATFDVGMTGQAFSFAGVNQAVEIAYDASFFATPAFSVEAWVNPSGQVNQAFIFGQSYGRQLIVRAGDRGLRVAFVVATSRTVFYRVDSTGEIPLGQWTHLVGTWDGASTLSLYINGALDLAAPLGVVPWDSGCAFHIGGIYDPEGGCAYQGQFFKGLIDEMTYYSQALAAADVQALYNAGSEGKCAVPPAITSQPKDQQTVTVGNDAILRVSATGSSLNYQWFKGEDQLWDQTQPILYIENVGTDDAGAYTVKVWNESELVTSEAAVLTVAAAEPVPTPAGAVAWWRADGDDPWHSTIAEDCIGNNPATREGVRGNTEAGKVGWAFLFGADADLLVPHKAPSDGGLDSALWEGFTIEGWIYPYDVDHWQPILEQWDSDSDQRITLSFSASGPGSLEVVDSSGTQQLSSPPGTVRLNTFQHFALAYSDDHAGSTFLRLYLNGQLVAENTAQLGMALGANDFYFGCSPYTLSLLVPPLDPPPGTMQPRLGTASMDELTVYNRALADGEILGIYNASSAGKIPPCGQVPAGCVSWWQGEGDGADVYGLNPAVAQGGVSFTAGQTGQALTFSGAASARVLASASLNVGAGQGFTVEAWVKPTSVSAAQPILEWSWAGLTGVALWVSDSGTLSADIPDASLMDNPISCGAPMAAGVFQHVALTYDSSDSMGRLFLNGAEVGETWCLVVLPILTTGDLCLGFNPTDDIGTGTQFTGQIDEVGLFGRALTALEIKRLYAAGGGGKCGIAPSIVTQPLSQTANVGNNVAFRVVAAGTSLTYQWSSNDGEGEHQIAGATCAVLTLPDLQTGDAGTYSVTVRNAEGSVTSSGAVLTVNPVGSGTGPQITSQPPTTSVCEGQGVELTVGVGNHSGSLAYQWCKNGINLNGATGSSYTFSHVSPGDQGTYKVIVYDSAGWTASADAVLTIYPRPSATLSVYGDSTIQAGEEAHIQAVLTGTGPWTLVWSDGTTESQVTSSPHIYTPDPPPTSTTTYKLSFLSDAHCSTLSGELTSTAVVTVDGASLLPPKRAWAEHLTTGDYNNFIFGGDRFYYIDGTVHLYGTTTIEGGTVVLFPEGSVGQIVIHDPDIICDTGPYRTAAFISTDVLNFVPYFGEPNPPSAPAYYGQGLSLAFATSSSVALKYLQFFNLGCGISVDAAGTYKLYDCQFTDCNDAVAVTAANADVRFYNILFADNVNVFAPSGAALSAPQLTFQHITVDNSDSGHNFVSGGLPNGTWAGLNSLLINAANVPSPLHSTCISLPAASGLFLTGGDGSHYLAPDTYQGQGATDIDGSLLAELAGKTTQPPLDFPVGFATSGSLTLGPQVARYTSGSQPDLGYYADALDYTVSSMAVLPGGSVTVLPGTAIGLRNDWFAGVVVCQGASFTSQGTPDHPITFAPVWTVQEGPFPYMWFPGFLVSFVPDYWPAVVGDPNTYADCNPTGDPPPVLNFRFSNLFLTAGSRSHHFWSGQAIGCLNNGFFLPETSLTSAMSLQMRDCALHGGWVNLGEPDTYGGIAPVAQPWWPSEWLPYGGPAVPSSVSLVNNLFDRVNINLDPDTGPAYWGGPYPNPTIDLRLTATNNTFRGGWLALEPIKASSGNWVFENNLFDKTVFAQDQYQPLDYDYNAYRPCEPEELDAGQLAHLVPTTTGDGYTDGTYGGAHELALTERPPYEPGPLGNFYLPNEWHPGQTSPLAGAGSCSPAGVGLFHYTTSADPQTKEEGSTRVDIGLHYVATMSMTSRQAQDYDNDGIPDYVENWHGDGDRDGTGQRLHAGTETDWKTDYTDAGVHDTVSALYDDVDLSGNGLVGRIKKALNLQPLDTSNPITLTQITTGQEPDIVGFKVGREIGGQFVALSYDLLASIGVLNLNLDGFDVTLQDCTRAAEGDDALLSWNSTYEPPGLHFLQARLTLNGAGLHNATVLGLGPLAPFYSDNVCRFFESDALFDQSGAYLDAQLPVLNANYSIRLYDPSTTPPTLLKTIGPNSTSSGMIQEDWEDLTCDQGPSPFAGSAFDAVFDITLLDEAGTPIAHGTPTKRHGEIIATEQGNGFDVAYMYTPMTFALLDSFYHGPVWVGMQGVVDLLTQPGWPWSSYASSFDRFTWPGDIWGYPGYVTSMTTITGSLYPSLTDGETKNLYCYGHGTPNWLGNAMGDVYIRADEVAARLGNHFHTQGGPIPAKPYRFVFLDACDTASDNQWRDAFGIMSLRPGDQAGREKLGPQAFVGWAHGKTGCLSEMYDTNGNLDLNKTRAAESAYTATLCGFYLAWMNGATLYQCINLASDPTAVPYPLPVPSIKRFTIGPPFANPSFIVINSYPSPIYIVGHSGLTRSGLVRDQDGHYLPPHNIQ